MSGGIMITERTGRGGTILFAGTVVDVLVPATVTDRAFALLKIDNPAGCWTPAHRHRVESETVYVLSGTMRAELAHGAYDLLPGQALVLPRGQPHRLGNAGPQAASFLVLATPGGFDEFVRAAGRSAKWGEEPTMSDADRERLVEAAPRHGIELLPPDVPWPVGPTVAAPATPAMLDVLGLGIEVLAEPGQGDEDACLLRGTFPPGAAVPLHSHADAEAVHVIAGALEVVSGRNGWTTLRAGDTVSFPGGVPHALRNRGDTPATALLVATQRIAGLFREVGLAPGAASPGAPSAQRLGEFALAARARGFILADPS